MWVPDEKQAYADVELKEITDGKATVETRDGKVCALGFIWLLSDLCILFVYLFRRLHCNLQLISKLFICKKET